MDGISCEVTEIQWDYCLGNLKFLRIIEIQQRFYHHRAPSLRYR